MANTFEAFLGAVYTVSGIEKTQSLIANLLSTHIKTKGMITPDKQLLHEWCQQTYGIPPVFNEIGEKGPAHAKIYILEVWIDNKPIATGSGSNKKEASNVAARNAVQILKISTKGQRKAIQKSKKKYKNKKRKGNRHRKKRK